MRFFAELAYKGTNYNGWQIQQNAPTVQAAIEHGLSTILRAEIGVTGCGRTDTGVHASYYVAHFDCEDESVASADFLYHLNSLLPWDIAIRTITRVSDEAHARFDALKRQYKYYISMIKDPFGRDRKWIYTSPLDLDAMNRAASFLTGEADFTTFSKLHSNNSTYICQVSLARWEQAGSELVFTIEANRFLRNMVRSITGTLVDVGRGKISADEFSDILISRDRSRASGSAPAQGLFLTDVLYPEEIFRKSQQK